MHRKASTQIHSDNPCSTGGCEGPGKVFESSSHPEEQTLKHPQTVPYCKSNTGEKTFET